MISERFDPPRNADTPTVFSQKADIFAQQLNPWAEQANALADEMNQDAASAQASAASASVSANEAANRVGDVNIAAQGAFAAANLLGEWSTLSGPIAPPATVNHQGRLWYLKQPLADVSSQEPALGSAYWGDVLRNDYISYTAGAGVTHVKDRGFYRVTSPLTELVLDANPSHGQVFAAVNLSGAYTPVIRCNGNKIDNEAVDFTLNWLGPALVFQFDANARDWIIISGVTSFAPYTDQLAAPPEYGSNPSGSWIRWPSTGRQICTHRAVLAAKNWAALEAITLGAWTFPAAFIAPPSFVPSNDSGYGGAFYAGAEGVRANQVDMLHLRNLANAALSGVQNTINLIAIGNYK